MKLTSRAVTTALLTSCACMAEAGEAFSVSFAGGQWNSEDFIVVGRPGWERVGRWIQREDHIVNSVPADVSEEELISARAGETYASLLYRRPLEGNRVIRAEMSFDHRMAPSIVVAEPPGVDSGGRPEFRTCYEVVLYDRGVNVWRHALEGGKSLWKKLAFLETVFEPGKKYAMTVSIVFTKPGAQWEIACEDRRFGFLDPETPAAYQAGVVACEGVNRFYSFSVESPE